MDLFEAQFSFKDIHDCSDTLKRSRINQWRMRKILPATKESSGSGYPATFSLFDLVHAELLNLFNVNPTVTLNTAADIIKNIRTLTKKHHRHFKVGDSITVTIDAGSKSNPIMQYEVNSTKMLKDIPPWSDLVFILDLGKQINRKVKQTENIL